MAGAAIPVQHKAVGHADLIGQLTPARRHDLDAVVVVDKVIGATIAIDSAAFHQIVDDDPTTAARVHLRVDLFQALADAGD